MPISLLSETGLEDWLAQQPAYRAAWVRAAGFKSERHRVLPLPNAQGVLCAAVVGIGNTGCAEDLPLHFFAAIPERLPPGNWSIETPLSPAQATRACSGWLLGQYSFDRYRGTRAGGTERRLLPPSGADVLQAQRVAAADRLVRDLVNTPASDLGPVALATVAESVATEHGGEFSQVVGEALLDQRLPMIHAVGRAGPEQPRLIDVRWGRPDAPRVTLVGKGVCFDTGGLDLKPPQSMALMKKDMGGAATAPRPGADGHAGRPRPAPAPADSGGGEFSECAGLSPGRCPAFAQWTHGGNWQHGC